MCLLFMYVANCAKVPPDQEQNKVRTYKLILASVRDEKYTRVTKPADFWAQADSHIVAGQDQEEFGTWLGLSKHGKLSVILNILGEFPPVNCSTPLENADIVVEKVKRKEVSRGALTTGFLRSSPGLAGWTYCNSLCQDPVNLDIRFLYKPFHLVNVDIRGKTMNPSCNYNKPEDLSSIRVTYLTNRTRNSADLPKPQCMTPQVNTCQYYGFGNSMIDKPFKKVSVGRQQFMKLIEKYSGQVVTDSKTEALEQEILQFLRSPDRHFPDEVLKEHAKLIKVPSEYIQHLSARFVEDVPGFSYGTRTHTIITVDTDNNARYHEWTMRPPVNPANPDWQESVYNFPLTPPN